MPATIRSDEIAGRWGLASYQNPNDRLRTEKAAQGQCKQPYVITWTDRRRRHASGRPGDAAGTAAEGQPERQELHRSPGPVPGEQDREIVSFDGRVLVTRFVDKDASVRYGNMVYVRCAPRA